MNDPRIHGSNADDWRLGKTAPVDDVAGEQLKGKSLDAALADAGLSLSGTADEKRARLAGGER